MSELRTQQALKVYVTKDELELFRTNAGSLSMSTWARKILLAGGGVLTTNIVHSLNKENANELARIGNNLNQIAYNLNVMKYENFANHEKVEQALDAVSDARELLISLRDEVMKHVDEAV